MEVVDQSDKSWFGPEGSFEEDKNTPFLLVMTKLSDLDTSYIEKRLKAFLAFNL